MQQRMEHELYLTVHKRGMPKLLQAWCTCPRQCNGKRCTRMRVCMYLGHSLKHDLHQPPIVRALVADVLQGRQQWAAGGQQEPGQHGAKDVVIRSSTKTRHKRDLYTACDGGGVMG